ncbi:MAG: LysR family transcriptional regulator [Alicyclobacillus sp.]|nr:LysR family transcriptional regulator [Alicyclobacillus sp.]
MATNRVITMDWNDVSTFLAVAEAKSMTEAARHLHISQSAISKRIQSLENELKVSLFIRSHSGVQLTAAGKSFLPYAVQVIHMLANGIHSTNEADEQTDVLRMGVTAPLADLLASALIQCFDREHLPVRFKILTFDDSKKIVHQVSQTLLDAGLISSTEAAIPGVASRRVWTQSFYLVGVENIVRPWLDGWNEMTGLGQLPYVLPVSGGTLRHLIDEMFASRNLRPEIVAETDNVNIIHQLVQHGVACTISANPIPPGKNRLLHVSLDPLFPARAMYFIHRHDLPDRMGTLINLVSSYTEFYAHSRIVKTVPLDSNQEVEGGEMSG